MASRYHQRVGRNGSDLDPLAPSTAQDWADPNSRSDGLHTVHAALHGGRMDFVPERIHVLRRVLEPRFFGTAGLGS